MAWIPLREAFERMQEDRKAVTSNMVWILVGPNMTPDALGLIPGFLSEDDPRSASEQMDSNYCSGWRPQPNFQLNKNTLALSYPGDPDVLPLALTMLREETIVFYPYEYLMILAKDGSFEVCRVN